MCNWKHRWSSKGKGFTLQNRILHTVPITTEQQSVSFQLQLALEASSGSQLTDAEEKLSDSLTAHTESGRDGERKLLSVHMFIHSQRALFYLPTRSRLLLFPLPPTLPHSRLCRRGTGYSQVITCCRSKQLYCTVCTAAVRNSNQWLMARNTVWIGVCASILQEPLFQLGDSEGMLHA